MARRPQSLKELARIANVGGDIKLGQWYDDMRRQAEAALAATTDKAKALSSGDYKGEKILEGLKFASSFFGPIGKGVGAGLSLIDMLADAKKAKKSEKEFKKYTKKYKDKFGPYAEYMQQNINALSSQLEQTGKSQKRASMLSGLTDIGLTAAGVPFGKDKKSLFDKLGTLKKETLGKMFPQITMSEIFPFKKGLEEVVEEGLGEVVEKGAEQKIMEDYISSGAIDKLAPKSIPGTSLSDYITSEMEKTGLKIPGLSYAKPKDVLGNKRFFQMSPKEQETMVKWYGSMDKAVPKWYLEIPNTLEIMQREVDAGLWKGILPEYKKDVLGIAGEEGVSKNLLSNLIAGGKGLGQKIAGKWDPSQVSAYDFYKLGYPMLQRQLRKKGQALSPAAPAYKRPSIRRRIR